jgi:hypothetical protein
VKLTLEMTKMFTPNVIEVLGLLPSLRTLHLRVNKDQDGELQFLNKTLFEKLEVLEIVSKSKLHVSFGDGTMKKLEQLNYLHNGFDSVMEFSGREHPVSLKQVWLLHDFPRRTQGISPAAACQASEQACFDGASSASINTTKVSLKQPSTNLSNNVKHPRKPAALKITIDAVVSAITTSSSCTARSAGAVRSP